MTVTNSNAKAVLSLFQTRKVQKNVRIFQKAKTVIQSSLLLIKKEIVTIPLYAYKHHINPDRYQPYHIVLALEDMKKGILIARMPFLISHLMIIEPG
ncbi:hypothetical protein [Prevotella fusca]